MLKKHLTLLITVILIFSCTKKSQGLKKYDIPPLIRQFLAMHVQYHTFNDELSERTLGNFINSLDYGKYYFYKKDIDQLMKHKDNLDDYIRNSDYSLIDKTFNLYLLRFKENMKLFDKLIKKKFDFNRNEKILVDRDKISYPKNAKEMSERWRKNIKLQLLNYLSADQSIDEAKSKLKKKYKLLEKRVGEIDEEKLLSRFMNSFSMALDPHSNYLTQDDHEDFSISMKLKLEGIGVRLRSEDGFVYVESIIAGGATDKLPKDIKLKSGDRIIAVAQSDDEAVDVIDMDLRDVVKKIRGKKGTEVRLTILRDTEEGKNKRMIVPIIREEIKLKDSDAESDIHVYNNEKNKKIGYIKLPSFYYDRDTGKSSSGDIKSIMAKLKAKNVDCILLDLRGNPGGLLNEAIEIAGLFIKRGPILQIKEGGKKPHIIYDTDDRIFFSGPVVILIDKFSASASEILAGAIKDYGRGLIIGPRNTFGKGTVQSYNELPFKKGAIKITISIFYQPGGTSNQLYGIKPDINVPALTSIWDIGEIKTRYPLKWKKIRSADFEKYRYVNPRVVGKLKKLSASRISANKKYKALQKKINKFKKQISSKSISLKEESIIEKQKKKELEKNRKKEKSEKIIDLENDLFLEEAINITNDYMNSVGKR